MYHVTQSSAGTRTRDPQLVGLGCCSGSKRGGRDVTGREYDTGMAYAQPSQDDFFSTRGSIRGGPGNRGMFELGEAVVGKEVMPFSCPLPGF